MKQIEILGMGIFAPRFVRTNEQMKAFVDTSDEWITSRTGIKKRHVQLNKSVLEMANQAGLQAIENSRIDKNKIRVVIVCTFTSEYRTPSIASLVQRDLGLNENVITFDLNAACSGFVYGLVTASSLLNKGDYALVIGSEAISSVLDMTDRNTCVLFGDGAGAAIISNGETQSAYVAGCIGDDTTLVCKYKGYLQMEGKQVFKFAVKSMEKTLETLLIENKATLDQLDYIVAHQANARIIASVQKKMSISDEKMFMNLEEYGNTSAASIPLALGSMEGLKNGMKIALIGFGSGLTYGGVIVEWRGEKCA